MSKLLRAILGATFLVSSYKVTDNYVVQRQIENRPIIRIYNGLMQQIEGLDKRIEYSSEPIFNGLVKTRDDVAYNLEVFYSENFQDILEAHEKMTDLKTSSNYALGIAALSMAGLLFLSRRIKG